MCEEAWASDRLEEHSELCAVLRQVGQGMSVDAHLTTLANVIEEQAGPGFDSRAAQLLSFSRLSLVCACV